MDRFKDRLVLCIVQCAFEDRFADRFTILKYFKIADRLEDRFIVQDFIIGRFPDRLGKARTGCGPARSKSADRLAKWVARTLCETRGAHLPEQYITLTHNTSLQSAKRKAVWVYEV